MEYTEQDAELIIGAVMASASHVERDTPTLRSQIQTTVKLILDGVISASNHDPYALDLVSAARLMREAREQGATEMRERAARRVYEKISSYDDWHSDAPEHVRDVVLSIPVVGS